MLLLLTCRACYEKGTVAGLACDKSVDAPIAVGKFARARVAAPEGAGPATSAHLVWLRRSAPEIPVRVTVKPSTELAGAANPGSRNRFGRQSARAETAPPARANTVSRCSHPAADRVGRTRTCR